MARNKGKRIERGERDRLKKIPRPKLTREERGTVETMRRRGELVEVHRIPEPPKP